MRDKYAIQRIKKIRLFPNPLERLFSRWNFSKTQERGSESLQVKAVRLGLTRPYTVASIYLPPHNLDIDDLEDLPGQLSHSLPPRLHERDLLY